MSKYAKILKQIPIFASLLAVMLFTVPAQFTLAEPAPTSTSQDELQRQLQAIEQEIAQYEKELSGVQSQKSTLNSKIKQLELQKNKVQAQIHQTSLNIQNINQQINATQDQIDATTAHINELRAKIANLLPDIYDQDQQSTVEILLNNDGLIGFYNELDSYEQINKNLNTLLDQLDTESKQLQAQQDQLSDQEDQQKSFLSIQSLQSAQLASNIGDQNSLLEQTKGVEANYQATLKDKKAQAAKIQNRLYELFGVGPGQQVTFGQAVEIAKYASNQTGVRAAFLLAILTQESSLGKNVGTCNRAGDPPSKSYRVVMKPDRDIKPFLQITSDLGLDPETTPVSCPMMTKGKQVGWGGAMGPAQFIPSTWMGYKDKIAAITGKPANPWDIRDAFLATAIKTKADGAGTVAGEWAAAMKYFSGGTNVRFRFYGDNVVATANRYQADIDELNAN
jgi:peptidoglycan hydrolase CwlO-like protein